MNYTLYLNDICNLPIEKFRFGGKCNLNKKILPNYWNSPLPTLEGMGDKVFFRPSGVSNISGGNIRVI